MPVSKTVRDLLGRLSEFRKAAGLTAREMDERLLVGPGWTARFEAGEIAPSIDLLLAMLNVLGVPPGQFLGSHVWDETTNVVREMYAEPNGDDLAIHFRYTDYNARYSLKGANLEEFEVVLRELQNGLARLASEEDETDTTSIQTDSVARTFLRAVETWPKANPSDLWWFIVYRAYCDPFNHPASHAQRDFGQSWRRTGGWALEEVLVRYYGPFLKSKGINLLIASGQRKRELIGALDVRERLEPDKVDVLLTGVKRRREVCFGVVHVKSSFAERRTDDVPMSRALIEAGYTSPLWTMDCKSTPSAEPLNRGELGAALGDGKDSRSAKRKDIEDDGYFSACFSYNANTIPTPVEQKARSRIVVCDFSNPDDEFTRFIIAEWKRLRRTA